MITRPAFFGAFRPASVVAADWYVDPLVGNDANTGHSSLQALQTFAPVPYGFTGKCYQKISGSWIDVTLQAAYVTARKTLWFHWNMATFQGVEIATADLAVNTFNPPVSSIDFGQWTDLAVSAEAPIVALTTKHQDGFCLWPTAYAHPYATNPAKRVPYSVAQTAWYAANGNPDLVGQFVTAARAAGLEVVFYFTIQDNTYETRSGKTAASDAAAYIAMIEAQLTELLTNYGPIKAIFTDSWGWSAVVDGYNNIPYATIRDHIHSIQPDCLLLENCHEHPAVHSELEEYEVPVVADGMPAGGNTRLSDALDTMSNAGKWFYAGETDAQKARALLIARLNAAATGNYCYSIDFGPRTSGLIPPNQYVGYIDAWCVSYGATATASSSYPGYPPSYIADWDWGSFWSSNSGDPNVWVELDLGSEQTVASACIWNRSAGGTSYGGWLRDLTLTVYDESRTLLYTSPLLNPDNVLGGGDADYTNGPNSILHNLAAPVSGRYVRLTRTPDGGADQNRSFASREFRAYSKAWSPRVVL